MGTTFTDVGGVPQAGGIAAITAATIQEQQNQLMSGQGVAAPPQPRKHRYNKQQQLIQPQHPQRHLHSK